MFCRKCGAMISDAAKFCSSCGESVSAKETSNAPMNNNAPMGYAPMGNAPMGNAPMGNAPMGNAPMGNAPMGNAPMGNAPMGNAPMGNAPMGNAPMGNAPMGNAPMGNNAPNDGNFINKFKNMSANVLGAVGDKAQKIGNNSNNASNGTEPERGLKASIKCLPSFILGLIGGICGIFGGLCTTMCDVFGGGNAPFLLIFCGSIIGLVGACACLSKARIGSIIELASAIMIMICAYGITGSGIMSILAMLMFLFGGIIGIVYSFIIKRNQ